MGISDSILQLKSHVKKISQKTGRPENDIKLVLVTKTVSPDRIREAYDSGIRDFGENRIQEWLPKAEALPPDIRWHFIGRLQTNKVKYLMEYAAKAKTPPLLQSLDREELAAEIEKAGCAKEISRLSCLLQVNTSGEASKAGFSEEGVMRYLKNHSQNSVLQPQGLMTIGPLTDNSAAIHTAFRSLKTLQEKLRKAFPQGSWDVLSMGMSSDYEIAIEEGANLIRIGTAVFGARA